MKHRQRTRRNYMPSDLVVELVTKLDECDVQITQFLKRREKLNQQIKYALAGYDTTSTPLEA